MTADFSKKTGQVSRGSRPAEDGEPPAHGGRRTQAEALYGIPRQELLDFSASINPMGPPPTVAAAARAALVELPYYPDEEHTRLRQAMADYLGVSPEEVVPGNGSSEVIYWLAALLSPRRVLIVEPTFSEYRRAAAGTGAACDSLLLAAESGFALDTGCIHPEAYDLVFLCNPNNPTGYLVPADEVAGLWRRCRAAGTGLVVDEAFIEFVEGGRSVLSGGTAPGLYVVRSFTKSHALAGLRLGCLVAEADFASRLRRRMPPWNINAVASAAARAALADRAYRDRISRETAGARRALFRDLSSLPNLEPLPSEANFILCHLEGIGAAAVTAALARQGILVRDCRSFAGLGDGYIRVAVRTAAENHQLVSALRRVLENGARRDGD